jgi:hypothetical protein
MCPAGKRFSIDIGVPYGHMAGYIQTWYNIWLSAYSVWVFETVGITGFYEA